MNNNYFAGCNTNAEIKAMYRKMAKALHPDCGGSEEAFKDLQQQFKAAFDRCGKTFTNKDGKTYEKTNSTEVPEEFMEIINKVIHMDGVTIEIIGSWVWLTGNTMQYKEQIKEAGFWWSKNKKAWYFNGEKEKTHRRGRYTMDQLRNKWGTEEVKTEKQEKITAA